MTPEELRDTRLAYPALARSARNCAAWTHAQYATARIGAILINLNPAYRTHELAYALDQSEPDC